MKKILFILIITTLFKQLMFGQGGFSKNYVLSGSYVSVCTDVIEAPNGNIIMTGLTYNLPGNNILTIIGSDAQGNKLWQKNYGTSKFEYLDNSDNFSRSIVKGINCFYFYSSVKDSNNKYFSVLIKFNYNGDTLWQKKYYDPSDYLYIYDVIQSVDNGFLMTGAFEGSNRACLLIKTDSMGKELWRKKLTKTAPPNVQSGEKLIQDSLTKKIIIAGYQFNGTASVYNIYANIIVTDSLGIELQRKSYTSSCAGSAFRDLIQTKDKNIVAVGFKDQCSGLGGPGGSNRYKGYAVKVDLNNINTVLWSKEVDVLSVYNSFATVNELKNGDLILSGILDTLKNYGVIEKGMLRVTKLDKDGNIKANKLFSRDNVEKNSKTPRSLSITQNGSYLIANELYYATNPRPYSITKIDSMFCDSTVAYCYSVGFDELKIKNEGLKIYPNPTNGIITIETANSGNIQLKLTNVLGQLIKEETLKLEKQTINLVDLKNGIYFLQLFDKNKLIGTRKIVKE